MFNPFMNYTPSQFGNIFAQSNNFYSQLPPHLQQQFIDLVNEAQTFVTNPNFNMYNNSQESINKSKKFVEKAVNFFKQLPPYLQQQFPYLNIISNSIQQQTTQIFSNSQPQPVINPLNEKINQLIRTLENMLFVPEADLAFTHRQISNVIKFLNDVKNNPNNNETNYIFDIIGRLSSNNPEENAINLLITILDNSPEIMNGQDKTVPQLENSSNQPNL